MLLAGFVVVARGEGEERGLALGSALGPRRAF